MKFKIWDNEIKDFVPVTAVLRSDGEIFIEAKPGEWANISEYPGRFIECFSSGMGDDNGREIYHGDIIGVMGKNPFSSDRGVRWVNWGEDMQWICSEELHHGFGLPLSWAGWQQRVVIGNIFQNRGLIDKEPVKDSNGDFAGALPF